MNFNIVLFTNKHPRDLLEWFAYHKVHGCTKFYVCINSEEFQCEWSLKYVDMFDIYLDNFFGKAVQVQAYDKFIHLYGTLDEWCFVLDDDEYLVPFEPKTTVSTSLDIWNPSKDVGYKVAWKFFGSSGHEERVLDGLTIENYLWCQQGLDKHHKSMFVPRFASRMLDPHTVEMFGHTPLEFSMHFYIAHYHTKSKEEYREKCDRPRADNGERRNFEESFAAHDINEVFNTDVAYWGKAVRELIKGL